MVRRLQEINAVRRFGLPAATIFGLDTPHTPHISRGCMDSFGVELRMGHVPICTTIYRIVHALSWCFDLEKSTLSVVIDCLLLLSLDGTPFTHHTSVA